MNSAQETLDGRTHLRRPGHQMVFALLLVKSRSVAKGC